MRVWGRVQGVLFRDSARRRAKKLGLTGCAKNLPDGSIEIMACGAPSAIDELFAWAKHGPPFAHVTKFEIIELETPVLQNDFLIL